MKVSGWMSNLNALLTKKLPKFLSRLNEMSSSRENMCLVSGNTHDKFPKIHYLHIQLFINDKGLSTCVHYKPTDLHYCSLHSSSPSTTREKNAIPFSRCLRLRRLCSDDTDFNNKCEETCQYFSKNAATLTLL